MALPAFPNLAPLALEHRAAVTELLRRRPPVVSELTFTNLYMWRDTYRPQVGVLEGLLCVKLAPAYRSAFWLPPAGEEPARAVGRLLADEGAPSMERVPPDLAAELRAGNFQVTSDLDNSDYVYRTADLVELKGNRYHQKRTNLRKFEQTHRWEYRPLTPDLLDGCRALQEQWCDVKGCDAAGPALQGEARAVLALLEDWERLEATGGVILVEGRVAAFAAGEQLNADTAVVHVEKADGSMPGVYQLINREFARQWAHLPFINREQDMGDPGLRQAKESYRPDHMIEKFVVRAG